MDDRGHRYEATVSAPARLLDSWPSGDGLTVLTVDARVLRASGARTVQEALRSLPGVALADEQGNAFQHDLAMRGLTASPVTGLPQGLSVFLDGVRLNEPAVEEVNFDLIPLADVERIEIVRGPNAIFGRNTLGGAIHIITRRGGEKREAEVELEGGSSLHQESRARVAGTAGPFDGYLSLGQTYESGWRAAGSDGYVGSQYFRGDEANVAPKLAPYLLARAGAEARWRTWTASLRVTNLFDHRYETFGTFAPNAKLGGSPVEPFLTPGPPLRIVAGLRWELG